MLFGPRSIAKDGSPDEFSAFPDTDLHQFANRNFPGAMPMTAGVLSRLITAEIEVSPVSSWDKPMSAFRAFYRLFLVEPSLFVFTGGRELVQMVEIGIVNGRQLQLVSQFEKSQIIFR